MPSPKVRVQVKQYSPKPKMLVHKTHPKPKSSGGSVALSGPKTGKKPASTMRSHPYGPPAGKKRAGAMKAAPAGSKDARAAHAAAVGRDYPGYRTKKQSITKTTIRR